MFEMLDESSELEVSFDNVVQQILPCQDSENYHVSYK